VQAAAELIYERGVSGTSNEDVRRAAGVSGSQLSHYFPDKDSLVRAVVRWRADRIVEGHRAPAFEQLDSLAALHTWARTYLEHDELWRGGCSYGSLAAEVAKTTPPLHADLAAGFQRWLGLFRQGLGLMRERGHLQDRADPDELANVLMAAFQGGTLLAQVAGDVRPLRAALLAALAHVESYTSPTAATASLTQPDPTDDAEASSVEPGDVV